MRHGGHLVAHVLGGFLKPFLGHALFPPLEVPRRIGDAPSGGPCGSLKAGQRVLADLLRQCPGNVQKAPGGLAGDLGDTLRERLGFFLPGPIIPSPAHEGVNVGLLVPREAHVLHLAVYAGVRPPTAPEEGTNPPTEQAADCTAKERTDAGHHGTDGRSEPATNPRACADIWLVREKQATRKGTEAEPCAGRAERAEKRSLRTKRIA